MEQVKTKVVNGIKVETYELDDRLFERACALINIREDESGFDCLEYANEFAEDWANTDFDKDYRDWLKKCLDAGAEIYTYKEDWQPIGEIAVFS